MRHLLARDVRPVCFGMVSWVPRNGFVGRVFDLFWRFFGGRRQADSVTTLAKLGPLGENLNKNSYLIRKLAPLVQLARLMSSRIVLAAQMNSNAPSVVVTAADSSE